MKVLAPISITPEMLTSSTVAETDHAEWVAGTAYTAGQKVIRLTTHKVYEALTSTTGDTPETSPTKWLDLGATNRWKAFDQKVGTTTTQTDSMEWVVEPGQITTSVGFLELVAESVRVRVSDAIDGVVYDRTQSLRATISVADYYTYCFEPISRRPFALFDDLPSYRNPTITVTVSGLAGETVGCGVCILGHWHEFADAARYGATVGIRDYSKKKEDDWGNLDVREGQFSKRGSWQFLMHNNGLDKTMRVLASLRAKPALYVGSNRFDATLVYGFYRDFSINIEYFSHSECSIELEGLI